MKRSPELYIVINLVIELALLDNKKIKIDLVKWAFSNLRRFPKLGKVIYDFYLNLFTNVILFLVASEKFYIKLRQYNQSLGQSVKEIPDSE